MAGAVVAAGATRESVGDCTTGLVAVCMLLDKGLQLLLSHESGYGGRGRVEVRGGAAQP